MPTSCSDFRQQIKQYILEHFPDKETTILDLGTGEGTYGNLLKSDYPNIDGLEVWTPYFLQYRLFEKYREFINLDVREFEWRYYDIVIAGDIIEHLSVEDAKKVIKNAKEHCKMLLVAVPYQLPQGAWCGNDYEIHLQDDLTEELFNERYPGFEKLFSNGWYNVFVSHQT